MSRSRGAAVRRREFIKAVAGFATAWPVTVHAQQPERIRRIGVSLSENVFLVNRQVDGKYRAFADPALHADRSIQQLDEGLNNVKTQPRA